MFRNTNIEYLGVTYKELSQKAYKVHCGCMTFIFIGEEELTDFLLKYIHNPDEIERKWKELHGDYGLPHGVDQTMGIPTSTRREV